MTLPKSCKGILLEPMYRGVRGLDTGRGPAYYASDEGFAASYGPTTKHRLCLKRPLQVDINKWSDFASNPFISTAEIARTVKAQGFDSVVTRHPTPKGELVVALVVDRKHYSTARSAAPGAAGGASVHRRLPQPAQEVHQRPAQGPRSEVRGVDKDREPEIHRRPGRKAASAAREARTFTLSFAVSRRTNALREVCARSTSPTTPTSSKPS